MRGIQVSVRAQRIGVRERDLWPVRGNRPCVLNGGKCFGVISQPRIGISHIGLDTGVAGREIAGRLIDLQCGFQRTLQKMCIPKCRADIRAIRSLVSGPNKMCGCVFIRAQRQTGAPKAVEDIGIVRLCSQADAEQFCPFPEPAAHQFHHRATVPCLVVTWIFLQDRAVGFESVVQAARLGKGCRAIKKLML